MSCEINIITHIWNDLLREIIYPKLLSSRTKIWNWVCWNPCNFQAFKRKCYQNSVEGENNNCYDVRLKECLEIIWFLILSSSIFLEYNPSPQTRSRIFPRSQWYKPLSLRLSSLKKKKIHATAWCTSCFISLSYVSVVRDIINYCNFYIVINSMPHSLSEEFAS